MASILHLGARLEAIVDLCPITKKIADIGCDHGYVTAELILEDKAKMVVATEKSEQCLNKAIILANTINIAPFISFRQGDGFEPITKYDKIDCAVIAGMGGEEIIQILQNKPRRLFDFVLQPMKDTVKLREYLLQNHFKIEVDKLVKDGDKFYNVIKTTHGRDRMSDIEVFFGRTNFTDNYQVFYEYLIERQKKLNQFKAQAGVLGGKLQTELDFVNQALELYKDAE
jgi:tRNA (adenine22-N1)-methyltransferase